MRRGFYELDRVVLEAVSEDYQSFEALVSKLSRARNADCGVNEIEKALLGALAKHLVSAYLLHADPPYATEVGASPETIQRYWFAITEEGREYLRELLKKQSVVRTDRTQ